MIIHYLDDFAESFYLLFSPYADVLAGLWVATGMLLVVAWAVIPAIAKRV